MLVAELWRYPVKSLQGERLDAAALGADGIEGDRRFALFDPDTGLGLTARRVPELLFAAARLRGTGRPRSPCPTARSPTATPRSRPGSARRSSYGPPTWPVRGATRSRPTTSSTRTVRGASFPGRVGCVPRQRGSPRLARLDRDARRWDRRRFRANVLLDGEGEDALVGSRVVLGDAVLDVRQRLSAV